MAALCGMPGMSADPFSTSASFSGHLASKLQGMEARLDALQAEAMLSGAAATDFAGEACDRIATLEAELHRLSCAAPRLGGCTAGTPLDDLREELTAAGTGLLEDVRGCVRRLLASSGRDLARALEDSQAAAVLAAERAAAEAAARESSDLGLRLTALELRLSADHDPSEARRALLEARDASASVTAAEARIMGRVSQCVGLIDAACSPANRPGLAALKDLVDSVEAVSARVASLEEGVVIESPGAVAGDALSVVPEPHAMAARIATLERDLPAMQERVHHSLRALWAALREVSRGLRRDVSSAAPTAAGGSPEVPPLPDYEATGALLQGSRRRPGSSAPAPDSC